MNKLFTKITSLALGAAMMIGVGVSVGSKSKVGAADATNVGDKVTSYGDIENNATYYIGATVGSTDYYWKTSSYNAGTGLSGTSTTDKTESPVVTLIGSGTTWAIQFSNGNYLSLASSKANGKVNIVASKADWTVSNQTGALRFSINGYSLQKNSGTSLNFGSYADSQKDIWLELVAHASGPTKYAVSYNSNDATSGTVPTSGSYESGATVTVAGNTGNLVKIGYTFGGWSYNSTTYQSGDTFTMPASAVELVAVWNTDTLNSLSISGSMTKTSYKDGDSWSAAGFTVTGNYQSGATPDVTSSVTWSFYVGGSEQATASTGDTSVVVRASFGGKTVDSTAQAVTVIDGVTFDLTKIDGFSSWTTAYRQHDLTNNSFSPTVSTSASLNFLITNKQGSGTVGTTYPCIGGKTNTETTCLTFTLSETGKKISSVEIVFVTRYTSTYPSLYLHKGNGIATEPLSSLTMSGSNGDEHTLEYSNLNDTVFTVGYNAHQTGSNGAVGIKSISIGLATQSAFGTLDHISVTALPNVVYHVGETFDFTGFAVTAYDGVDESTANFKDVTSSVETDLDNPSAFVDGDVPGFDCDVQYEESSITKTTSFHVYVYALAEYELVTTEPSDWSGQYLIVGTNGDSNLCAMNGGLVNPDVESGYKVVTSSNDVIEAGQELEWTIASVSGGYSIQGKSGKYIGSLTGKSNGMLVSNTALVNTLSISGSDVTIQGTNTYNLTLQTAGDRFRYYSSGTVQLYKLVESSNADAYAQLFLETLSTGSAPICEYNPSTGEVTTDFDDLKAAWKTLATSYASGFGLTAVEKEQFRLGVASETGDNIAKALALYDHIAKAYNTRLQDSELTEYNFMDRDAARAQSRLIPSLLSESNTPTIIIIAVSVIGVSALGGFFFLRKRKEI